VQCRCGALQWPWNTDVPENGSDLVRECGKSL